MTCIYLFIYICYRLKRRQNFTTMKVTQVKNKKTGEQGHMFHLDHELIPTRIYHARFKGNGGGYVGKPFKGSELEVI